MVVIGDFVDSELQFACLVPLLVNLLAQRKLMAIVAKVVIILECF